MPKIKQQKDKKKGDFKIYGVRKEEDFIKLDRELPKPYDSLFSSNGSVVGIFAPPGSGKSNLISNLILRDEYFKDLFPNGVYIVSPTILQDLTSTHLRQYADFVETEYSESLIKEIMENIMGGSDPLDQDEERGMSCVILDDILGMIKQVNSVCNRLASTCRHLRSVVFFSLQAVKGLPATIRSNLSMTLVFYQPSKKQFNDVVELHSLMGGEENFIRCYNEATSVKYGYLLCDWRKMTMHRHGGDCDEPELLWRMFDDEGKRINYNDKVEDKIEKPIDKTCI
tara:strand:- start:221 stop:1069 length:849 start_codon:yes stop_codon:yes gene_type:complete